ncbi:hypothetical protein BTA51_28530 [Hahella sp. CCB-MM4]|uniref:hypothetical protein n=1 Tax=Hahella sp. (strain CCB-MM4) TaxID=1926491 RepID=UPI000B9B2B7C|nr:hypothetical protein [Hahella sp. CCB-MM4]OZG69958.1 hypothetical protein BTA51_28530 [Hahella sp. CCB-MM4]
MKKLRTYRDKEGLLVELLSLNLRYIYEGVIEGSRSGAHYVFRSEIDRELTENSSLYVVGFSEKDQEVENRWADEKKWPPHEEVTVRCRSKWVPEGKDPLGSTIMTIRWYQDEGDPFSYLSKVLSKVDWMRFAIYKEFID